MESIPLYDYITDFSDDLTGVTLYDENLDEIGLCLGADIIDNCVYVHDGYEIQTKEMTDCYVIETI
jgi:hypothetical protein